MGKIPVVSAKDVRDKVVLIRVDHNVVKKGEVDDNYRIDRSKPTTDLVIENGGHPILMTHIGRPRDKKTGIITISEDDSIGPIVEYIKREWGYRVKAVDLNLSKATEKGLPGLDDSVYDVVKELKAGKVQMLYLPNTRWFTGEEEKDGPARDAFTKQLVSIADIFVNDAFGSAQAHVSTYWITKQLPSFAGLLMRDETTKLKYLIELPREKHPFLAIVAGEKIDTKIGALSALRNMADHLLVGGLPANAIICAKYGVSINGIEQKEIDIAKDLLAQDQGQNKLLIPNRVIVSDVGCNKEKPKQEGRHREVDLTTITEGTNLGYVYDVSPAYFRRSEVMHIINGARTIFTNAVVGFDKAGFKEGTIELYQLLAQAQADESFGGGDTLKAVKKYTPDFYKRLANPRNSNKYTLFTGGGAVLDGFESGKVEKMDVVKALIDNGGRKPI